MRNQNLAPAAPRVKRRAGKLTPIVVRLNRNLMNYPLARDARVAVTWRKQNGQWAAALPGEDHISLICDQKLWPPTALDIAVLFQLLAEIQRAGLPQVTPTQAELLRRLGLTVCNQNRKTLRAALSLWTKLMLRFERWHDPKNGRMVKVLPPPIVALEYKGKRTITIHEDWHQLALAASYYETVTLPLPVRASDQNAALLLLTSAVVWQEADYAAYHPRAQSSFARKIGLGTKNRNARLRACLGRVPNWFTAMGGELSVVYADRGLVPRGKIGFIGKKPRARQGGCRT